MFKAVLCSAALLSFAGAADALRAQPANSIPLELANLREDVRLLSQRTGELQLRLEQLERENTELRNRNVSAAQSYATVAQLNEAVSELNRAIKTSATATKNETLQQVSGQLEKLAKQTNAAMDALAKSTAARSPISQATTFSEDFPKEGISYTVQKGDTVAVIAKKTGAQAKDIINANRIADPSKIQVGQTLFIPGGK